MPDGVFAKLAKVNALFEVNCQEHIDVNHVATAAH